MVSGAARRRRGSGRAPPGAPGERPRGDGGRPCGAARPTPPGPGRRGTRGRSSTRAATSANGTQGPDNRASARRRPEVAVGLQPGRTRGDAGLVDDAHEGGGPSPGRVGEHGVEERVRLVPDRRARRAQPGPEVVDDAPLGGQSGPEERRGRPRVSDVARAGGRTAGPPVTLASNGTPARVSTLARRPGRPGRSAVPASAAPSAARTAAASHAGTSSPPRCSANAVAHATRSAPEGPVAAAPGGETALKRRDGGGAAGGRTR